MTDRLSNPDARRLFLALHGLADSPGRPLRRRNLPALVRSIGFVQVDSIRTVERAHHHILAARNTDYRPDWLAHHLQRERTLFENWTHDASIIPVEWYPYWKPRFRRTATRLLGFSWWRERLGDDHEAALDQVHRHIRENGPAMARDLGDEDGDAPRVGRDPSGLWWGWRPSKSALEFLWRTGRLAVAGREGFQKVYDLVERVIPEEHHAPEPDHDDYLAWACGTAIERLGFATHGEIAAYWDAVTPAEAKAWCEGPGAAGLRRIEVEDADGGLRPAWARPDLFDLLAAVPALPARVRILSPFDPALRDRRRAQRLFGFDYRIEIFVPAEKRKYGYYVFPVLERDRVIGRIDMKASREAGTLDVARLWPEPGIRLSRDRTARFEAELERWRRYLGLERVTGWPAS